MASTTFGGLRSRMAFQYGVLVYGHRLIYRFRLPANSPSRVTEVVSYTDSSSIQIASIPSSSFIDRNIPKSVLFFLVPGAVPGAPLLLSIQSRIKSKVLGA